MPGVQIVWELAMVSAWPGPQEWGPQPQRPAHCPCGALLQSPGQWTQSP